MRPTSYPEIVSGRLEAPEQRFAEAINLTLHSFQQLVDEDLIAGGFVMGSATVGDADPLSDLDAVVLARDGSESVEATLFALSGQVLSKTAVLLEVTCHTELEVESGDHTIAGPMYEWLLQDIEEHPERLVGQNPIARLCPETYQIDDKVGQWLKATHYMLQKRYLQGAAYNQADELLAFSLSVPHVAARKSLNALHYIDDLKEFGIRKDDAFSVRKDDIAALAQQVYGHYDPRVWELYQETQQDKADFLQLITHEVAAQQLTRDEYEQLISHSLQHEILPRVLELLEHMKQAFYKVGIPVYDEAEVKRRLDEELERDLRPRQIFFVME